tara:strand:+ start:321 stop:926 length:606 start_codon:yes stop_codon:yes gene_type:complete
MKKIIDLIKSYQFYIIFIIFYEFVYILFGYKGNSFFYRKSDKSTDTIPCPYYFLNKIYDIIKKEDVNSFIDLGCGNGRVLYYFNKKIKIKYTGVELFKDSYNTCLNTFKSHHNVKLINANFFDLNFNDFKFDCFFLNDPLVEVGDHNKLINSIISSLKRSKSSAIFVTVNLTEGKHSVFNCMEKLYSFKINSRNINIYRYI